MTYFPILIQYQDNKLFSVVETPQEIASGRTLVVIATELYTRTDKLVKVRYAETETGWAQALGGNVCRLDNIPHADGLNVDDIVMVMQNRGGELQVAQKLHSRYEHKAIVNYTEIQEYYQLRDKLQVAGGKIEGIVAPSEKYSGMAIIAYSGDLNLDHLLTGGQMVKSQ